MPLFYLDTSALVKRYRTERGTEVVEQLLANFPPEDRFFTSFLSIIELTSAILRFDGFLPHRSKRFPLREHRVDRLQNRPRPHRIHRWLWGPHKMRRS